MGEGLGEGGHTGGSRSVMIRKAFSKCAALKAGQRVGEASTYVEDVQESPEVRPGQRFCEAERSWIRLERR